MCIEIRNYGWISISVIRYGVVTYIQQVHTKSKSTGGGVLAGTHFGVLPIPSAGLNDRTCRTINLPSLLKGTTIYAVQLDLPE